MWVPVGVNYSETPSRVALDLQFGVLPDEVVAELFLI